MSLCDAWDGGNRAANTQIVFLDSAACALARTGAAPGVPDTFSGRRMPKFLAFGAKIKRFAPRPRRGFREPE